MKKNISSRFAKPLIGLVAFTLVASTIFGINFFASLGTASAATVNIAPSKDAYVDADHSNTNYGSDSSLYIRASSQSNTKRAYIGFDLSSYSSHVVVSSAKLYLYLHDAPNPSRTHNLYKVTSSWTESGIKWNNQPTFSGTVSAATSTGNNNSVWRNWNVTSDTQSFINGTDNYGWVIKDSSEGSSDPNDATLSEYYSKEKSGSQDPYLVLTYSCASGWSGTYCDTQVDTTAPTSSITSPLNGAYIRGTVTINATANDTESGVAKVEFWHSSPVPGVKIGEDTSSPYSISWDTTSITDGSHSLWVDAYDNANNHAVSALVSVTVDNTLPTLHLPSTITSEATGSNGAVITYEATADDMAPANPTVTCTPASGSTFPLGNTTVNCSATDTAGNTANGNFQVVIQDTTAPTITAPADQTFEATGPLTDPALSYPGIFVKATATDIADPNPTITYDPTNFPVGTIAVTWTATDSSGISVTANSNITIEDKTPATLTLFSNPYTLLLNTVFTDPGFTAIDLVDGDISGSVVITGDTVDSSKTDTYTMIYTSTDSNTNLATDNRIVNVVDTESPVINMIGSSPIDVEAGSTYTDEGATALDNYDGDISNLIVSLNTVNTGILGSYTVTYDVTDSSGNPAATVTRIVNVVDTTAPTIIVDPITINLIVGDFYIDAGFSASDIVDGDLTSSITIVGTVDTLTIGTYTITYNVTDAAGNLATQVVRTVNVGPADTTDPTIISAETVGTSTIEIVFSEDLQNDPNNHHPNASDFDVYTDLNNSLSIDEGDSVYGIIDVTYSVPDKKVTITLANPLELGDNLRLYVRPAPQQLSTIIDLADNLFNNGEGFDMAIENNIAPIISNEAAAPQTNGTSVTITWTTDHSATSRVIYDTVPHPELNYQDANYGYAFTMPTIEESNGLPMVTDHSVTISGLNPNTTYYFRSVSHGSPEAVSNQEFSATTNNIPPPAPVTTGSSYGGGGFATIIPTTTTQTEGSNLVEGGTQTTGGGEETTAGTGEQGAIGGATTTE